MKCVCAMEGEERWPNEKGEVLQELREVKQRERQGARLSGRQGARLSGRQSKRERAVKKAAPCRG